MKPLTLLIKPASGLCNLNCSYCFYKNNNESGNNGIMTDRTVSMLTDKIREFCPSSLSLVFQGGEPLLAGLDFYEDFIRRISSEISVPVYYSLQTNGLLIDDAFADFFKRNNFLIGLSLDGGCDSNDRYRLDKSGKSIFDNVMRSADILRKHNVDFNILSVVDDLNAKDIERTYSFFKNSGFAFLQFIPCIDENSGISLSPEAYGLFLRKIFDLWYDDFIKGEYISVRHIDNYISILMGRPPENCAMCGICGNYFVVEANGDLYPCDFYCKKEYLLGSIYDDSPFTESKKQKTFIEESRLIHEHCRTCSYHSLCRGGCRRDRNEDLSKNRYCEAYRELFDYSIERMKEIAALLLEN